MEKRGVSLLFSPFFHIHWWGKPALCNITICIKLSINAMKSRFVAVLLFFITKYYYNFVRKSENRYAFCHKKLEINSFVLYNERVSIGKARCQTCIPSGV